MQFVVATRNSLIYASPFQAVARAREGNLVNSNSSRKWFGAIAKLVIGGLLSLFVVVVVVVELLSKKAAACRGCKGQRVESQAAVSCFGTADCSCRALLPSLALTLLCATALITSKQPVGRGGGGILASSLALSCRQNDGPLAPVSSSAGIAGKAAPPSSRLLGAAGVCRAGFLVGAQSNRAELSCCRSHKARPPKRLARSI